MRRIATWMLTVCALTSCGGEGAAPTVQRQPAFRTARVTPASAMVGGCQIFPANNWWNTDVSGYPLDPRSSAYIAALP
jgi:hypothetical protein